MGYYHDVKQEIKGRQNGEKIGKSALIVMEQAIYKDLLAESPMCVKCGRKDNITLDHIVPKDILLQFGVNPQREVVEENYRLLCYPCNQFKSNKLDFSTPITKKIIIRLLEKL